jgi:AcrR family transcriptional regulator
MAQVKKAEVREAILDGAFRLFAERGYAATSLAEIAAGAGVATSTIYVYFASKLDILFALYRPWLTDRLERLAAEVGAMGGPRARLRHVFLTLWRDIPAESNGFANNLMQAFSTLTPEDGYSRALLLASEAQVSALFRGALPPSRQSLVDDDLLAHLAFMAFDGFVINRRINGPSRRVEAIVEGVCDLLLDEPEARGAAAHA